MIIDKILDRRADIKEGFLIYNPRTFYNDMMSYGESGGCGFEIASAMDCGEEYDVKRALARYIIDEDYNLDIINFINSVKWLEKEKDCDNIIKKAVNVDNI